MDVRISPSKQAQSNIAWVALGTFLATTLIGALIAHSSAILLHTSTSSLATKVVGVPRAQLNAPIDSLATSARFPAHAAMNEMQPSMMAPVVLSSMAQSSARTFNAFWIVAALGSLMFNGIAGALLFAWRANSKQQLGKALPQKRRRIFAMASTAGETEGEDDVEAADDYEGEDMENPVARVELELAAVKEKLAEAEKKYIYAVAEVETIRRRGRQQVEDAQKFGIEKFARDMLEVADNMNRGLAWVPKTVSEGPAGPENPNPDLRSLFGGMKSTEKIMMSIFERHGIQQYYPLGEVYDPNLARAIAQVPKPDAEPGTVLEVINPGYLLNGRVLRAADVVVVQDSG